MKTFETEKHNIPEGATHYSEEQLGAYFCWYIVSTDSAKIAVLDGVGFGLNWHDCEHGEQFGDNIKPIPQTNIETPEEKEALDLIDTTPHQYETSKFSGNNPRTKVEYVKCEFDSFSDVYSAILDNGDIYGYEVDGYRPRCYLDESGSFIWRYKERCASHSGLQGVDISQLYRRIETPITEREAFIESVRAIGIAFFDGSKLTNSNIEHLAKEIYDSGKFKLVGSN